MEEVKKILEKEINKLKSKIPKNGNDFSDLQKRLKYIELNLELLQKGVNSAINEYISDKNLSDLEVKKIEVFCANYISEWISSLF